MESKEIYTSMQRIMNQLEAITKDRRNVTQNYTFRGIDDVYNDLHDLFARNGVFTTSRIVSERSEEKTTKSGGMLIYRVAIIEYTFHALDGSFVTSEVLAEGMDSGDKAANKAMAVGHKYAILQALMVPTEDAKDPENTPHDLAPKHTQPAQTAQQPRSNPSPLAKTLDEWAESNRVLRELVVEELNKTVAVADKTEAQAKQMLAAFDAKSGEAQAAYGKWIIDHGVKSA